MKLNFLNCLENGFTPKKIPGIHQSKFLDFILIGFQQYFRNFWP